MVIEPIVAKLNRLKSRVYDAGRHLLTIPAMPKEGNIARMNVRTSQQLKRKLGFVLIVEILSLLTHQCKAFVAQWNVGLQGQEVKIGRHVQSFSDSVCNVVRNSGRNLQTLRCLVGDSVLDYVRLIRKEFLIVLNQASTRQANGSKQEKESLSGTTLPVSNAVSVAKTSMSTIKSISEMVGQKVMKTLSRFVQGVICLSIGRKLSGLNFNIFTKPEASLGIVSFGAFLLAYNPPLQ